MKSKMVFIAVFLCLAGLAMAAEYTDVQKSAIEGLNWGFKMGQAYQLATEGKDIAGFNAKVDEYNAWVREFFGEDPDLLMEKMTEETAPINLQKPVLVTNDTSGKGIVHEIDGEGTSTIRTNDMNLLSDSAIADLGPGEGEYLGGV